MPKPRKFDKTKVIQRSKNESVKLLVFMVFALTIAITPAFAELDLSNQKIVSLDGKLILEFGENIQTFKRGGIIETPQLDFGTIRLADRTVFLEGEYTNILANSFSVLLDDGKIYAKNNQDGTFTVKVLTLNDNGFQKQTFASILQPIEIIESSEIIEPTEKIDTITTEPEEEQYVPELIISSSHDFKTYWKDTFNIDVQAYDARINPSGTGFEGRIDGVDVTMIISLGEEVITTLKGVTVNGEWIGEHYIKDNIVQAGEYTVDVLATLGEQSVSKSSSMFIIGTAGGSDSTNHAPVAIASADNLTPNVSTLVTLDASSSSDSDGDILTYSWVETTSTGVSLSDSTAIQPTFTTLGTPDTYIFELTVTDPKGKSSTDSVTITVS